MSKNIKNVDSTPQGANPQQTPKLDLKENISLASFYLKKMQKVISDGAELPKNSYKVYSENMDYLSESKEIYSVEEFIEAVYNQFGYMPVFDEYDNVEFYNNCDFENL